MANFFVSTISALTDVIKDELQYKKIRDLTDKKETLMTQIGRVGLKLGSRLADYNATRIPRTISQIEQSEPTCTDRKSVV